MYNALLKNPPFQAATGCQRWMNGTKHMGYIGPLSLLEVSLSKKGVNGNLNFHVGLFWFCFSGVRYELAKRVWHEKTVEHDASEPYKQQSGR